MRAEPRSSWTSATTSGSRTATCTAASSGYAADNAITFAAGTALGPEVLTGGFTISYLRPAQGTVLRAEAKVVHAGSRQATCTCELSVVDEAGATTLCAIAQGTVIALRR